MSHGSHLQNPNMLRASFVDGDVVLAKDHPFSKQQSPAFRHASRATRAVHDALSHARWTVRCERSFGPCHLLSAAQGPCAHQVENLGRGGVRLADVGEQSSASLNLGHLNYEPRNLFSKAWKQERKVVELLDNHLLLILTHIYIYNM